MSESTQQAEALWQQCNAAAAAGNEEATDRLWREFVRVLWTGMRGVPWVMPVKESGGAEVRA